MGFIEARYRGDSTMAGYYLMYLRKSRADAEKERYGKYETLAVHEEQLTKLARMERLRVAEVYRELVSGETIEARTEFKKVMDRISDPDCEGVIVHAIDRLGNQAGLERSNAYTAFMNERQLPPLEIAEFRDPGNSGQLDRLLAEKPTALVVCGEGAALPALCAIRLAATASGSQRLLY